MDGKTPIASEVEKVEYKAGGLKVQSPMKPDDLLNKALAGARQAMANQAGAQMLEQTKSHAIAQQAAQAAAENMHDPFGLEPAALAVFMYLSREIEYRDMIIEQISKELAVLGRKPIDVKHPYPYPEPLPQFEAEAADKKPDSGSVN